MNPENAYVKRVATILFFILLTNIMYGSPCRTNTTDNNQLNY